MTISERLSLTFATPSLYAKLRECPPQKWSLLAPQMEILACLLFKYFKSEIVHQVQKKIDRAAVIWLTGEKVLPKEPVAHLIRCIYGQTVAKVLIDDISDVDQLNLNCASDIVEAAILSGRDILTITKLLPWYQAKVSKNLDIKFLLAAIEKGNGDMVEHLLGLNLIWKRPEVFPLHYAARYGQQELVLKKIKENPGCLLIKDHKGLLPIHYAAEGLHQALVKQMLLIHMMIEPKSTVRINLFPNSNVSTSLIQCYLDFASDVVIESQRPYSDQLEDFLVSFLVFHSHVLIGSNSMPNPIIEVDLKKIDCSCIIVLLLSKMNVFCMTSSKYSSETEKINRYLRLLDSLDNGLLSEVPAELKIEMSRLRAMLKDRPKESLILSSL